MSKNFGYIRIIDGIEQGRFLDQKTFDTGEEAVEWLEKNAWGVWGLATKLSEGEEYGGGGLWLFQHVDAEKYPLERVVVRRLDDREQEESDYWERKVLENKKSHEGYLGSVFGDSGPLHFFEGKEG